MCFLTLESFIEILINNCLSIGIKCTSRLLRDKYICNLIIDTTLGTGLAIAKMPYCHRLLCDKLTSLTNSFDFELPIQIAGLL